MLRKEVLRAEHRPDYPRDIELALAERIGQRRQKRVGRLRVLADEKAIELANEEPGGDRLFEYDAHDIVAVPLALLAEDRLAVEIVEVLVELELIFAVGVPTRESAGCFLNVFLGVAANAEAEQLHHLAGVVFVRLALDVAVGVEVDKHRHVLAHVEQERLELAERMFAQQLVLVVNLLYELHLSDARNEVVMPEERHLFAEGMRAVPEGVKPPAALSKFIVFMVDYFLTK